MQPIYKNGSILLWGTVSQDPKLLDTRRGTKMASFSMKYSKEHNVDGRMENKYMNVMVFEPNSLFVGDEDIGVAKGDTILVCGELVEDTYRKEGDDSGEKKWKVIADVVIDMTSIFQVAQMLVGADAAPEPEDDYNPKSTSASPPSAFEETDELSPWGEEVEDSDAELPY